MSNSTSRCFTQKAPQDGGPPLFQHGNVVFQAHHVGWLVTGFFTIIATVTSFWLVNRHLRWYTNKREQRYIVRILFMVPIYATISFASYLFWNHHTPLLLLRDCYESIVLTAFFYLLLAYLSPNPDEQRAIFLKVGLSRQADTESRRRGLRPTKWMFPLGFIKWKPENGLYFLQLMKWGVLQYCVVRPLTTLIAIILDYVGLYCEDSLALKWGHPYIIVIVSISVSVAMYCLVQLYIPISTHLAPHKPLLKLFAIKAVVFLTFWQATLLGLLATLKVVKDSPYMTADDINVGYGAILETMEMTAFSFLHIRAFSYKPYRNQPPASATPERVTRMRALVHVLDFRETFRELWQGTIYLWDRVHGREPKPDKGAIRAARLKEALGKSRPLPSVGPKQRSKGHNTHQGNKGTHRQPIQVQVDECVTVDVEGERQWLGVGDDYAYGLGYSRREKSEALGVQISKELRLRGYDPYTFDADVRVRERETDMIPNHKRQTAWWRNIYDRISRTTSEQSDTNRSALPKNHLRSAHGSGDIDHRYLLQGQECDEPSPLSAFRIYRNDELVPVNVQDRKTFSGSTADTPNPFIAAAVMESPIVEVDQREDHLAAVSEQQLSPLLSHIGKSYMQNHGNYTGLDARSPRCDVILPTIPQPMISMPRTTTQTGCHASEIAEIQVASSELYNPNDIHNVLDQHLPNDAELPPPVPPKSPRPWTSLTVLGRYSHRRELAQHSDFLSPPLSPTVLPCLLDPLTSPGSRSSPPRSLGSRSILTPISSRKRPTNDPEQDHPEPPSQPLSGISSVHFRSPKQSMDAAQAHNTLRRPRRSSYPVPIAYSAPGHPPHSSQRQPSRRAQHRISVPLDRIPQDSVLVNLSSGDHISDRLPSAANAAHASPTAHNLHNGISGYRQILEPNSRYSHRLSHVPRRPIMPQPLARNP